MTSTAAATADLTTATATTPGAAPTLLKMQAPIASLGAWIDRLLLRYFPVPPYLLWAMHFLLALTVTLLLAWLLGGVVRRLGLWAERRGSRLWAEILQFIAPTLRWVVLFAGMADAVEDAWPAVKGPPHWVAGALFVIAAAIGTRGVVRLSRLVLDHLLRPALSNPDVVAELLSEGPTAAAAVGAKAAARAPSEGATSTALVGLIQRLLAMVLWLSGLIVILDHFGQNISSVVAALGVTSLAISLASQQALSNIIAGLVLALDHPFRIGDRVKLPGGDTGDVLEIGMRSTAFRLPDGSTLIVPNADLVSSRLVNQTRETAVRAEVRVTVPATLDIDRLTADLIEDAGAVQPTPLSHPPVRVQLLSVTDKVELAVILWLPRSEDCDASVVEERLRRAALKRVVALLPPTPTPTVTAPPRLG